MKRQFGAVIAEKTSTIICWIFYILGEIESLVVIIIMYVMAMKMEMLWNGYEMIFLPFCCGFTMVQVVIRWFVIVYSWVYKAKEAKKVYVPAKRSYGGKGYGVDGSFGRYCKGSGVGYRGSGLYVAYGPDDRKSSYGGSSHVGGLCRDVIVEVLKLHGHMKRNKLKQNLNGEYMINKEQQIN